MIEIVFSLKKADSKSSEWEGDIYFFTTYIWKGLQYDEERGVYIWDD